MGGRGSCRAVAEQLSLRRDDPKGGREAKLAEAAATGFRARMGGRGSCRAVAEQLSLRRDEPEGGQPAPFHSSDFPAAWILVASCT